MSKETEHARSQVVALREKIATLADDQLDLILREARTFNAWTNRPVSEETLRKLYSLMIMGPTHANTQPARIIFVVSSQAKERLIPLLMANNQEKSRAAPVNAILGYEVAFHTTMPYTFPIHPEFAKVYQDDSAAAQTIAAQGGNLQAAYMIIAARALGLDCGPMGGFDHDAVDKEFFANTSVHSNIVCNLGYGDIEGVFPRLPRLEFEETCRII